EVTAAENGGADLSLKFERMAQRMDLPMMPEPILFDTDVPDDEMAAASLGDILSTMIGMPFQLAVDKQGNVTSASGMEAVVEKIDKKATANQFWGQMKRQYTDDAMKVTFGNALFMPFAYKDVNVGDTWEHKLTQPLPGIGDVLTEFRCKLDRVTNEGGRKLAVVTYEQSTRSDPDAEAKPGPMGLIISIESSQAVGTAYIDVERGCLIRGSQEGTAKFVGRRPGAADDAAPAMSVEAVTEISLRVMSPAERQKDRAARQAEAAAKVEAAKKAKAEKKAAAAKNAKDAKDADTNKGGQK
ncbi:MAG: DUF6263 family protein, partial [Phycisphaerae bacterium]